MAKRQTSHDYAVIGLGRFGASLALKLVALGHSVLGVDRDIALSQSFADELTQTVAFDATDEDALKAIGVAEFDTVIVAIADDFECNLMTTVMLKELGVRRVICKASSERQKSILLRVGADQVILPEYEAGVQLAYRLVSPFILDRLELEPGTSVSEMRATKSMVGKTIDELGLPGYGLSVLLIKGERIVPAPAGTQRIAANDILVMLGPDDAIALLSEQ